MYYGAQHVIGLGRLVLQKHFQVTMTFKSNDKYYDLILDYIGSKCKVETGRINASTTPRTRKSWSDMLAEFLGGKEKAPSLYYQPDLPENHANNFVWKDEAGVSHKIYLSHHIERPQMRSDSSKAQRDPETLSLTMWWTTDPTPLKQFLTTGLAAMVKDDTGGSVDIYVKHMWLAMWTKAISREKRDRDTVILDEGLADYVVEDMRHFFKHTTASWYHNAGIPYRRGYLLYGPPGCGKTSFAQVLAGELGLDVCLMNLSNSEMNDDDLAELLRAAPARSMLLLEDVDAIFVERAAAADKEKRGGGVSFSGLLNALDGAAAQEGCVIMLTTNHKERLDEALIRPGRCDVHVKINKASQTQAKRMFWRFFAKQATIKVAGSSPGTITTTAPHFLLTGDLVSFTSFGGDQLVTVTGKVISNRALFYVRKVDEDTLSLYDSAENAAKGGKAGLLEAKGGKDGKLSEQSADGIKFSTRIPEQQVSMAKLQGYLMKQKLLAEQDIKKRKDNGELEDVPAEDDASDAVFRLAVHRLAAETSIMNVHELLDVKQEVVDSKMPIYDHFRRVGLHRFATFFEHYGIRFKDDLNEGLCEKVGKWEPDLKVPSSYLTRLTALIKAAAPMPDPNAPSLDGVYDLADLSVLRDRFLVTFKDDVSQSGGLQRAASDKSDVGAAPPPGRIKLLRASSGVQEEKGLKLLEMAHHFQERLENNGKTDVSIWQLDMHFKRFAGDPVGALENCQALRHSCKERSHEQRSVAWTTTFAFLRRIGLEEHAYQLEEEGYKTWAEWKHLTKDEIKNASGMQPAKAAFCHACLTADAERPDFLRLFQLASFDDIIEFFRERFPHAPISFARRFAVKLTDELGWTDYSCYQITEYLKKAGSPEEAVDDIHKEGSHLLPLDKAIAARKPPQAPPPAEEPTEFVHVWLKEKKLECHSGAFLGQALSTKEDLLDAPLDHKALDDMGIKKMGDRCTILRMLKELKA
eukprot:TRINITY_DN39549_c0_g1_i3.p1 TRINITY_DN39549_c0_g1~~TRINITY_DN39549_c0_g1_i3.p1  ORF type:complete len:1031 (+),score=237.22 TRINITY_DN39549_c0_g1_i3:167-3094(+)